MAVHGCASAVALCCSPGSPVRGAASLLDVRLSETCTHLAMATLKHAVPTNVISTENQYIPRAAPRSAATRATTEPHEYRMAAAVMNRANCAGDRRGSAARTINLHIIGCAKKDGAHAARPHDEQHNQHQRAEQIDCKPCILNLAVNQASQKKEGGQKDKENSYVPLEKCRRIMKVAFHAVTALRREDKFDPHQAYVHPAGIHRGAAQAKSQEIQRLKSNGVVRVCSGTYYVSELMRKRGSKQYAPKKTEHHGGVHIGLPLTNGNFSKNVCCIDDADHHNQQ
eukprot:6190627-Pleurochrysis_carterae.AAC.5